MGTHMGSTASARARIDYPLLSALAVAVLIHLGAILAIGFRLPEPQPTAMHRFDVIALAGQERTALDAPTPVPEPDAEPATRPAAESVTEPQPASAVAVPERVEALAPAGAQEPPPATPEILGAQAPTLPTSESPVPTPLKAEAAPLRAPEPESAPGEGAAEPRERSDAAERANPPLGRLDAEPLARQPAEAPAADPAAAISAADIFASRDAEIGRLAARIEQRGDAYANRTRRKAVSTATREYLYANYMEAWRRKVERIGNLNYPAAAKERGLYGSLILHVAVRADGSLERVRVVRSSGHDALDQAAVRIVKLAAPFSPFPPGIRAETDVLDITRTWQFQRNNRLGWER
jgi:protein TonB